MPCAAGRVGPAMEKHLLSALLMRTIKSSVQLSLTTVCFDSEQMIESDKNSFCLGRSGPRGQGANGGTR